MAVHIHVRAGSADLLIFYCAVFSCTPHRLFFKQAALTVATLCECQSLHSIHHGGNGVSWSLLAAVWTSVRAMGSGILAAGTGHWANESGGDVI